MLKPLLLQLSKGEVQVLCWAPITRLFPTLMDQQASLDHASRSRLHSYLTPIEAKHFPWKECFEILSELRERFCAFSPTSQQVLARHNMIPNRWRSNVVTGRPAINRGLFEGSMTIAITPQHLGPRTHHRRWPGDGQLGGAQVKPRRKVNLSQWHGGT